MAKQKTVIIIHGSYGSPDRNWFPWLRHEVKMLGHRSIAPQFPTPEGQDLQSWMQVFFDAAGPLQKETILIGHSVGAGFVLNILNETSTKIDSAFLVAGFLGKLGLPDFDPINETLVSGPFDWQRIKANANVIDVINAENDPYVPISKGEEIAANLSVPLTRIPGGGHLNQESGYTSFPLLLDLLQLQ